MSISFGKFIKEKRIINGQSLKDVAEMIGISAVYQSSIETGKRPAPSYELLLKLRDVLNLGDDEFGEMLDLAAKSKNARSVAVDIADYINENDIVHKALRFAIKENIPQSEWENYFNTLIKKYN